MSRWVWGFMGDGRVAGRILSRIAAVGERRDAEVEAIMSGNRCGVAFGIVGKPCYIPYYWCLTPHIHIRTR